MTPLPGRSNVRECRVDGCTNTHPRNHLMCRRHWLGLPKPMRDEHWRVCRTEGLFGAEYEESAEACFAYWDSAPREQGAPTRRRR